MSSRNPPSTADAAEALLGGLLHDVDLPGALACVPGLADTDGTAEEKAHWTAEVQTLAATALPDLGAMTQAARELLTVALPTHAFEAATLATNAFICAGRYQEALATQAWAEARAGGEPQDDEGQGALLQINLAEADYNLGGWDAAWRRLEALDEASFEDVPLLLGGLRCQRAWIAAARAEPAPVHLYLDTFDPDWLPRLFRAELYYCKVACHLFLGDRARAADALEQGLAWAVRASSRRNGRFLKAQLLAQRGERAAASAEYAAAAEDPYKGQGAGALLAWGELLAHTLQQPQPARAAWRLAVERDPESAAAREAAARLQPG